MIALDLDALRAAAEMTTPGPWGWNAYRAAFDPPTALALLDRLEAAEAGNRGLIATCEAAGAKIQALEAKVARVEALAADWATEGPSLVRHAHGARDVHEGSKLEQCADEIRDALNADPA